MLLKDNEVENIGTYHEKQPITITFAFCVNEKTWKVEKSNQTVYTKAISISKDEDEQEKKRKERRGNPEGGQDILHR